MAVVVKNLPDNAGDIRDAGLIPKVRKIPWRRAWQPCKVKLNRDSDFCFFCFFTGVGTRNYYRKIGYRLQGPYMVKTLE